MAYEVSWVVRHRVLYVRESNGITLDDIREATRQVADLMDDAYSSAASLVIGIVDLRESRFETAMQVFSSGIDEIAAVVDARVWKAKPGFVVLIASGEAAKHITSFVIGLSKQPMTTVGNLEEALLIVRYMYPELQEQLEAYSAAGSSAATPG